MINLIYIEILLYIIYSYLFILNFCRVTSTDYQTDRVFTLDDGTQRIFVGYYRPAEMKTNTVDMCDLRKYSSVIEANQDVIRPDITKEEISYQDTAL